jgi:flagellar hook-basal body protein
MIKSLFSGVTGLKTHNQRMDVIGNNIANVNTTAFKAGTVTFKDVYYQTRQRASGGSFTEGGINPSQIGFGVQLGTIGKVMTQSGLTYSDSVFDCALNGSGFFQVMDSSGNVFYTRLGRFSLDDFGNLTDPNGNVVLGVSGDPTNVPAGSQRINLRIPDIDNAVASAVSDFLAIDNERHEIVISASGFGPGGNIALALRHSESPFANMSGSNLNVFMDLSIDYEQMAIWGRAADGRAGSATDNDGTGIGEAPDIDLSDPTTIEAYSLWRQEFLARVSELFSEDMREAIRFGGVELDPALAEISVTFNSVPNVTAAVKAENFRQISSTHALNFEMNQPGALGNGRQVNVETHSGFGVLASWNGSELTVRLPANGDFTVESIQRELNMAALGRPEFEVNVTAYEMNFVNGQRLDRFDETGASNAVAPTLNLNPSVGGSPAVPAVYDDDAVVPAGDVTAFSGNIFGTTVNFEVGRTSDSQADNAIIRFVVDSGATADSAEWDGNTLTVTLMPGSTLDNTDIDGLIAVALGTAPHGVGTINVVNAPSVNITAPATGTSAATIPHHRGTLLTPGVPAVMGSRPATDFIRGRSLGIAMMNGSNSYFQSAFENIQQVTLTGGAFQSAQSPSDVEIEIDRDGVIFGKHAVHGLLLLGRIDIVEFVNPEGLQQVGTSYFVDTMASGPPQVKIASEESDTVVVSGALEMSNVDLSQEFSDMIITQRGFQANSRIITVSDSMLEELVNLKR